MWSRYKRENVRNKNPVISKERSDVPEMKGYVAETRRKKTLLHLGEKNRSFFRGSDAVTPKLNKYESTAL